MFSKIVFIIFVSVFSLASTATLASDDRARNNASKSPIIVNVASSESVEKQVANVESSESQNISSQGTGKNNIILPESGWLLGLALFGFVMLSNRSSI